MFEPVRKFSYFVLLWPWVSVPWMQWRFASFGIFPESFKGYFICWKKISYYGMDKFDVKFGVVLWW